MPLVLGVGGAEGACSKSRLPATHRLFGHRNEGLENTRVPPRLPLGDTRRTHVKDAAQDVAEDELGAAKDGGVKVLIVERVIFSETQAPKMVCRGARRPGREPPPRLPLGGT